MTYSEQAQTGKKEYAALKEASPEVMGRLVTCTRLTSKMVP
ncbi:hypothetical protein [Latilactobacillus sakei]